jgi:hypothetical protein
LRAPYLYPDRGVKKRRAEAEAEGWIYDGHASFGPLYTAPHNNAGRGDGNAAQNHHIIPTVSLTEVVAVKSAKEIAAGVAARLQAEKAEELAAAQEGAQKLTDLRVALEPLRHDYGALFDDGPAGEERSLWVRQDDRLVAKWTRRGRILVFQPESTRLPPRETIDVEQAIAITVEFLMRRRGERHPTQGGGRLAALRGALSGW